MPERTSVNATSGPTCSAGPQRSQDLLRKILELHNSARQQRAKGLFFLARLYHIVLAAMVPSSPPTAATDTVPSSPPTAATVPTLPPVVQAPNDCQHLPVSSHQDDLKNEKDGGVTTLAGYEPGGIWANECYW
ncbi:hypothetical protein BZA77DRAFT_354224 [Pyronema omphalodes]|nr:hypothetical protein BZA77DRAFT_354224 [Pyronema omphalodes]